MPHIATAEACAGTESMSLKILEFKVMMRRLSGPLCLLPLPHHRLIAPLPPRLFWNGAIGSEEDS
jgi:hypothetical protein